MNKITLLVFKIWTMSKTTYAFLSGLRINGFYVRYIKRKISFYL